MENINPIKLIGNWTEGYSLDQHTEYSIYIGEDQWGRRHFDTKRTVLGQMVYELKYNNDLLKINDIINLISSFLSLWDIANKIDIIVPVPPTKKRSIQPVYRLADAIGKKINKMVITDLLSKKYEIESKDLSIKEKKGIVETIEKHKTATRKINILVIDDLYQSGNTLRETV